MRRFDPIVLGIVGFTIIIIAGITLAFFLTGGKTIKKYSPSAANRPIAEISETNFSFGKISVDDKVTKKITVNNSGTEPLIVSNTFTSCDCTFAQWQINGSESKLFSMIKEKGWREEITAGSKAELSIIYEPKIMPVKGKVERTVTFSTNDPQKQSIEIQFSAEVE